ncbi:unnamed protein product [Didymodactylos carnosus]|uniref:Homeobox domain-containing protein n=1 Tax=Didymodactylos carnosus TaxID=1234261 RepID=A0A813V5X1_9BILA|nr:unnamed protein product [Didymodactylos carnosus]CAF1185138.1 unnamed protein product [Didymodactylos carnosus]CAF3623653.1 unnamed protein product [Didymodactylos carnosus]CAF3996293.1 unnamed protein product [Didymodactylos carnosus]
MNNAQFNSSSSSRSSKFIKIMTVMENIKNHSFSIDDILKSSTTSKIELNLKNHSLCTDTHLTNEQKSCCTRPYPLKVNEKAALEYSIALYRKSSATSSSKSLQHNLPTTANGKPFTNWFVPTNHTTYLYNELNYPLLNFNKACTGIRSTSCNGSNLNNCHLSPMQVNSPYRDLETFIHHRRCRRTRTVFSDAQLIGLEKRFETQKYLSTPDRIELADTLSLSQLQVKTWYQNRRMKWKKQALQQCKQAPTKPKGRPKKNSIPSYAEIKRLENEAAAEQQTRDTLEDSSCMSDTNSFLSSDIPSNDDDVDDVHSMHDEFVDIEK